MRKAALLLLSAAMALATTGCFKHSYTVGAGANNEGEPTYDHWHSHWLLAIIGEETIDATKVCPSGNAYVEDRVTFVNGIIGALIGLIYYPSTVRIYCGEGGAPKAGATLTLTPEQLRHVALKPGLVDLVREYSPTQAAELSNAIELYQRRMSNVATSEQPTRF